MSAETVRLNPRTENLTGRTFGTLTVIAFAGYRGFATLCPSVTELPRPVTEFKN
jgi:hypothetical protein